MATMALQICEAVLSCTATNIHDFLRYQKPITTDIPRLETHDYPSRPSLDHRDPVASTGTTGVFLTTWNGRWIWINPILASYLMPKSMVLRQLGKGMFLGRKWGTVLGTWNEHSLFVLKRLISYRLVFSLSFVTLTISTIADTKGMISYSISLFFFYLVVLF